MQQGDRRHTATMDMTHSYEVCSCIRYDMFFVFHSLKLSAIYRSSSNFYFLPERPQNRVLQKYMDLGAFVLTIDGGKEQTLFLGIIFHTDRLPMTPDSDLNVLLLFR